MVEIDAGASGESERDLRVEAECSTVYQIVHAGGFLSVNQVGRRCDPVAGFDCGSGFRVRPCHEDRAPEVPPPRAAATLQLGATMAGQMDAEGFGSCTNTSDRESACPTGLAVDLISKMYADHCSAVLMGA